MKIYTNFLNVDKGYLLNISSIYFKIFFEILLMISVNLAEIFPKVLF